MLERTIGTDAHGTLGIIQCWQVEYYCRLGNEHLRHDMSRLKTGIIPPEEISVLFRCIRGYNAVHCGWKGPIKDLPLPHTRYSILNPIRPVKAIGRFEDNAAGFVLRGKEARVNGVAANHVFPVRVRGIGDCKEWANTRTFL